MIYQLYLIRTTAPAGKSFATLSEDEQKDWMARNTQINQSVGAREVVSCYSQWSNEEYYGFGVYEFPHEAARIEQVRQLDKIGWFQLLNAFTLLGTPIPEVPKPVMPPFPNPVYVLWLIRNDPAAAVSHARHSRADNDARFTRSREIQKDCGGMTVLACDSYWSNEGYSYFGVDAYPSFEALRGYYDGMKGLDWGDYISAETVLGIPDGWQG